MQWHEAMLGLHTAFKDRDYIPELAHATADRFYCTTTWHGHDNQPGQQERALATRTHVYVQVDAVRDHLQRPCQGSYRVHARSEKHFVIIEADSHEDSVSINRLKPAFSAALRAG
jgi:hypothetical protein